VGRDFLPNVALATLGTFRYVFHTSGGVDPEWLPVFAKKYPGVLDNPENARRVRFLRRQRGSRPLESQREALGERAAESRLRGHLLREQRNPRMAVVPALLRRVRGSSPFGSSAIARLASHRVRPHQVRPPELQFGRRGNGMRSGLVADSIVTADPDVNGAHCERPSPFGSPVFMKFTQ